MRRILEALGSGLVVYWVMAACSGGTEQLAEMGVGGGPATTEADRGEAQSPPQAEPGVLSDPVPPAAAQAPVGSLVMGGSVTVRCELLNTVTVDTDSSKIVMDTYAATVAVPGLSEDNFVSAQVVFPVRATDDLCAAYEVAGYKCTSSGDSVVPVLGAYVGLLGNELSVNCGGVTTTTLAGQTSTAGEVPDFEVTFRYNYRVE